MKKLLWIVVSFAALIMAGFSESACTGNSSASDTLQADTLMADTAAQDSTDELIAETPMPKAADELFDDFIFNFAANKRLQFERIHFPLPVYRNGKVTSQMERRQWRMDHFFMHQDFYTLLFDNAAQMKLVKDTTVSHVVVEKIYLDAKSVKQYAFNRVDGLWQMTSIGTVPLSQHTNGSFLRFYQNFATDSLYQLEHLHNPVEFSGPDPDDDFSTMTGEIAPETWPAFAPQLPSGMIYNIIYGDKAKETNRKIFVIRGIANGLEMELTFRHRSGEWELVKLNQ